MPRRPDVTEAEVIAFRDAVEFEAWLGANVDLQAGVAEAREEGSGS